MFYSDFNASNQQWLHAHGYRYLVVGKKMNPETEGRDVFELIPFKDRPEAKSNLLFDLLGPEITDVLNGTEPVSFKVNVSALQAQSIAA